MGAYTSQKIEDRSGAKTANNRNKIRAYSESRTLQAAQRMSTRWGKWGIKARLGYRGGKSPLRAYATRKTKEQLAS